MFLLKKTIFFVFIYSFSCSDITIEKQLPMNWSKFNLDLPDGIDVYQGQNFKLPLKAWVAIVDLNNKKGDVLNTARIAGINAAKLTSNLIPLAHNICINSVEVDFELHGELNRINAKIRVKSDGKTGVEIEALIAVQISLMTIYDMCKYLDRSMIIDNVKLLSKTGGKSGDFIRE